MNGHQLGGKSVHVLLRVQHGLGTFEGFGWVSWKGEKYLLGPGSNACNGFRCGSELAARVGQWKERGVRSQQLGLARPFLCALDESRHLSVLSPPLYRATMILD